MGLFWKRKKADQFVTLGLNEPVARPEPDAAAPETADTQRKGPIERPPELVPAVTGAGPEPVPVETKPEPPRPPVVTWSEPATDTSREKPVPSR